MSVILKINVAQGTINKYSVAIHSATWATFKPKLEKIK